MSGRYTSSAPIPIPSNGEPTELQRLISLKNQWTAVIERCTTHPHEVGSSTNLRNDKGYTALHTVTAYNHATHGDVLVPVVRALLSAADEIDYACAYTLGTVENEDINGNTVNTNEIVERQDISTTIQQQRQQASRGSWRLLFDNNNRARWTPIHLICVQGGIVHGKVAVLRSLLQMDEAYTCQEEQEEAIQYQTKLLQMLDRQNRNVLHHLLVGVVPSDEASDAIRFIVNMVPTLLFQQDKFEKTPLQYVLDRIMENPSSRRRHYMNSYGGDNEGMAKNYKMLKLLVRLMEEETNTWSEEEMRLGAKQSIVLKRDSKTDTSSVNVDASSAQDNERISTNSSIESDESNWTKNVLHSACRLPSSVCPDGSLIKYLCSEDAWKLEGRSVYDRLPILCLTTERDGNGDLPLHLFLSNKTYAGGRSHSVDVASPANEDDIAAAAAAAAATERELIKALLDKNVLISTPNSNNELPLHLAMRAGRRQAVGILAIEYYKAVLLDDDLDNNCLFMHVLSCISIPRRLCSSGTVLCDTEKTCLDTMFQLVRARPDIVSLGGTNGKEDKNKKEKSKWWKKLFSK